MEKPQSSKVTGKTIGKTTSQIAFLCILSTLSIQNARGKTPARLSPATRSLTDAGALAHTFEHGDKLVRGAFGSRCMKRHPFVPGPA
jgi:hypothetical protein